MIDDFKREFSIRDANVMRSVYIEVEKCIKKIIFSSLWTESKKKQQKEQIFLPFYMVKRGI